MKTMTIYKYQRTDGRTAISYTKPDCAYVEMQILVEDDMETANEDASE